MGKVRIGVIGVGGMGAVHANSAKDLPETELTAVCDVNPEAAQKAAEKHQAKAFTDAKKMFASGLVDGVVIAVPHYFHTQLAVDAFAAGVSVLTEKPIAVHKADALKMIKAHAKRPELKFAAMFQMRTSPVNQKIKALIQNGELGEIRRVNWIVTSWFRTQAYYDSGSWRATWKGEGGGVLLNQCPHQLDLFQWFFGMPSKVQAFCAIGKYHHIEVEDDVTAYCQFPNGATGVFITSTGESPGTDRLEITGDRGRLVLENQKLRFKRTESSVKEFSDTSKEGFAAPPCWDVEIPTAEPLAAPHKEVLRNFADAIANGAPLIAPAAEGLNSVELANSMLFSSMNQKPVDMPLDAKAFAALLDKLVKESTFKKKAAPKAAANKDMAASFHK